MSNTAYLAHSTFQEEGASSVRLAATANEDENIVSDFLTEDSKKYIYGTQYSKIEGTTINLGTPDNNAPYGAANWDEDTFLLPNNGDVLSNVKFYFEFTKLKSTGVNGTPMFSSDIGFGLIDKVTVHVGSNLWEEMTGLDLYLRNLSESSSSDVFTELQSAGHSKFGNLNTWTPGETRDLNKFSEL